MSVKDINVWLKAHPVNSSRGAPMGRPSVATSDQPLHIQALAMVDWCYDKSGAYWGSYSIEYGGMYCAFSEDLETVIYVRAHTREEAKAQIHAEYAVDFIR